MSEPRAADADLARPTGALTSQLSDALRRTRATLDAHAALLPDGTLRDLDAVLEDFDRRRLRIAVYGEVKAGKSTLVNALAGAVLSPVAFEPLTSLPVRITWGPETRWRVGNDVLPSLAALEAFMRTGWTEPGRAPATEVVAETPVDLLGLGGQLDLIDTPGVGADTHLEAVTAETLQHLDAVILVVRYPALFTRFTRQLADALDRDMGKLFVVWNVDPACAALPPADRDRHAAALRQQLAGAHDLFLVDARAACAARLQPERAPHPETGIEALAEALRRLAASRACDLTALRQAVKLADPRIAGAVGVLGSRHSALAASIDEARSQLAAAADTAAREADATRERFDRLATTITGRREALDATGRAHAADLSRALRAARRAWVRSADAAALSEAARQAAERLADALCATATEVTAALTAALAEHGATAEFPPWVRQAPAVGELVPDDRQQRGTTGRLARLRRALWSRWYLPGVARLERDAAPAILSAFSTWADATCAAARGAAEAQRDSELAAIDARATAEAARIRETTRLDALEAEHARLTADLPTLVAARETLRQLAREALPLLRGASL